MPQCWQEFVSKFWSDHELSLTSGAHFTGLESALVDRNVMLMNENVLTSQPLGFPVPDFVAPPLPPREGFAGQYAKLEPLTAQAHAALLFSAFEGQDQLWHYMYDGPFSSSSQFHRWVRDTETRNDPMFYAIKNLETGHWEGVASYLRIAPAAGSIEVGSITFSPALQRTRAATEAMYLMMAWAFEAGYRRYEWKCNALNIPSRRAAQRLGFSYEGIFRQAAVVKERNRDTAWFAAIDAEWSGLKAAFDAWLSPSNFDDGGKQRESLSDLTRLVRVTSDPLV
jgi:RimJ/RimL family protein N-acetyltransferase